MLALDRVYNQPSRRDGLFAGFSPSNTIIKAGAEVAQVRTKGDTQTESRFSPGKDWRDRRAQPPRVAVAFRCNLALGAYICCDIEPADKGTRLQH